MKKYFALLLIACVMAACGQRQAATDAAAVMPAATPATIDAAVYASAVANPSRPPADRERDAGRKPAEVLEFFGIAPGMAVLDLFSGGGYYSEILAGVVGPSGRVVAHTNKAYLDFVGDEFEARFADHRLPNVSVLMAENNELDLEADQFDAIMMVLSFHDIYSASPEDGWPEIDRPALFAELFAGLKPGGVLGIIDHQAIPGSTGETGVTVHRIDRTIVSDELEQAGFVLEANSDLLRNPDDDHSLSVFDPAIRGRTDRFVLKFRKPE
jgi:predicted methyltransferase